MKTNRLLLATATAVALAALTACGGGGGGGDATPLPPTPTPEVTAGNLLMTPQASPYAAGSAEKRTFDEMNRIRIGGGFGAMMYDATMDKAAKAHVDYWQVNPMTVGTDFHSETPGRPGFTGVMPWDRCTAANNGITGGDSFLTCSEDGTMSGYSRAELHVMGQYTFATGHLQNALNFRYNRTGMNFQFWAAGIDPASPSVTDPTIGSITVGYRADSRGTVASDKAKSIVGVYPFDGMTGVGIGQAFTSGGSSLYGLSILVQSSRDENPVVTTFTLRKEGATADTPTVIHQAGTMHGTEPTLAGWAILFPTVILDVNSKYTVTFMGSIDGAPVSKTWSFTTGTTAETRLGG